MSLLNVPETEDVAAVVADAAFANLDLMGETYYGNIPILQKPLTALTKVWGELIYGINANEVAQEIAVKEVQTPIFLIHSRGDETIRVENAERLKEALKANKNAEVAIHDRGKHGEAGGKDYHEENVGFYEKNL